jgi:hypothetical protein
MLIVMEINKERKKEKPEFSRIERTDRGVSEIV